MRDITHIFDAAILILDGRIAWYGPRSGSPDPPANCPRISAHGGCVVPGLIDCHTHIPFVGDRSGEFRRRIQGESYLSIMQAGGGIRVTTAAVRAATEDQLVQEGVERLGRMLRNGVTAVECKSGYGLSPDAELKQLRALRRLSESAVQTIVTTYMGAHAVPQEFEGRPDDYISAILDADLLRTIQRERLAEFCDVFCDRGAFDTAQSRRVLETAGRFGMRPRLHADELAQVGASRLAGEIGAVSADHLEHLDDAGLVAMRSAGTIAVVLPGTSFFLGIPHADARRMIREGLAVALATDCNPGSCPIESLPFIMNIACCQLRLTPEEVLAAVTANAASAIGRQNEIGAIEIGFAGDLVVLDAPDLTHWLYTPGRDRIRAVIRRGRVLHSTS